MKIKHKDYLTYDIPNKWVIEENENTTIIYDNNGSGALILSFYTIMELDKSIDEYISIMGKKFVKNNSIKLDNVFILDGTSKDKTVLYGTGKTLDNEFFKIWIIAKYPKVIIATYNSNKKTLEIDSINKIVDSFQFTNL